MVAIDTTVTPELADEGLARELAHRIQNLRRDARFELTDRIITYYWGPEAVHRVMRKHYDYICQETLSAGLMIGVPGEGVQTETQKVEGMEVVLGVERATDPTTGEPVIPRRLTLEQTIQILRTTPHEPHEYPPEALEALDRLLQQIDEEYKNETGEVMRDASSEHDKYIYG
jgi:hypothetical protein